MVKLKKQKINLKKKKTQPTQKSYGRLKLIAKFLITVILLALIGASLLRLKYMFVDSNYFTVKAIDIEIHGQDGSLRRLSLDKIGDEKIAGTNILLVDLNDLKQKIEAIHPEFKDIVVRRFLPNKLIVEVNLRRAIAQLRSDRYYLVDEEGVLLPEVKNFPEPDIPIITGIASSLAKIQTSKLSDFEKDKLDKAIGLIKEMRTIEALSTHKLKTVDIMDPGNLSFFLTEVNVEIKIGNSDFYNRLTTLSTVLDQLGSDINNFKYIDLRFEDPIVGPR